MLFISLSSLSLLLFVQLIVRIDSYQSSSSLSSLSSLLLKRKSFIKLKSKSDDYRLYDNDGLKLFGVSIPLVSKPTGIILNLAGDLLRIQGKNAIYVSDEAKLQLLQILEKVNSSTKTKNGINVDNNIRF